jgi:hypothetical protein
MPLLALSPGSLLHVELIAEHGVHTSEIETIVPAAGARKKKFHKKWTCQNCGSVLCVHRTACSECGKEY